MHKHKKGETSWRGWKTGKLTKGWALEYFLLNFC
jgi:hypothetical protein